MKRPASFALALACLAVTAAAQTPRADPPDPVPVPRAKIALTCSDAYFKTQRTNFLLEDESYPACTLRLPLALKQRWPGARTFYVLPRVSASLYAKDTRGQGRWLPLTPLVNLGRDPLHRTLDSADYDAIELVGRFGRLDETAGERTADTVSAGGKLTVCVAPIRKGETPCVTFDVAARFKVYGR